MVPRSNKGVFQPTNHLRLDTINLIETTHPPQQYTAYYKVGSKDKLENIIPKEYIEDLKNGLEQNDQYVVEISGYTDSSGQLIDNIKLGYFRAQHIKELLTYNNINPNKITVKSGGISTLPNEKLNRRAEIKITQ